MKSNATRHSKHITLLALMLYLFACSGKKTITDDLPPIEHDSTVFQFDHFIIWVNNPEEAKNKLNGIGFNAVPDSLSAIHNGQGTAGKYFNFLNTYIEFIYVYNQEELEENNAENLDLDFTERANFSQNGASPFGVALKMNEYDVTKIPFEKVQYQQEWMKAGESIYAAKNSKTNLLEPSIFVPYPELEANYFETEADLINIPEEYAFYRDTYKHANGVKKITRIIITSKGLDGNTSTMKAANAVEKLQIKSGTEHLMKIYFDEGIQGKAFDLRPELPIIVHF